MSIDPRFQRIARRLTALELVSEADDPSAAEDADLGLQLGRPSARAGDRFLGFYSRDGIRRALDAYGVTERLEKLGLGHHEVLMSSSDPYRHRVQVLLDGVADDDHRLIDLVIQQRRMREAELTEGHSEGDAFDMLLVEWLCLQNPRGRFSRQRPRLPGQYHPGLGLGHTFHNLTLLMAQRTHRDGVVNVPEHYHLAVLYQRAGYRFVCQRHKEEIDNVSARTWRLHLASAAWAVERGLVRVLDDDGDGEPWVYTPAEMVAPVSGKLRDRLGRGSGFLRSLVPSWSLRRVGVDVDALRQSLRDDPVEGLDPDDLLKGPG